MGFHRARKRFGQNFLHDAAVIQRIVDTIASRPGNHIVEIGPGQGALTAPLIAHYGHMHAIEIDRDLSQALTQRFGDQLTLHTQDVLTFDFASLSEQGPIRCVGNLPYNISTPILFHLFSKIEHLQDIHIMLQREVAQRMVAKPNNKIYGKLSVIVQSLCQTEPLFDIGPGAFQPAPKVHSSLIRLMPHAPALLDVETFTHLQHWVTQAFSQRRKTLRNTLKAVPAELLEQAGIDPSLRAENLAPDIYQALARLSVTNNLLDTTST